MTESTPAAGSGKINIGTSGWNYPEWRGKFYPKGLPQTKELAFMAEQFDTLEINSSFYRLMLPSTFEKWAAAVPPTFSYAVKGWKNITHMRRLKNVGNDLAMFFSSGMMALKGQLGPILWQLPPSLKFDADVLDTFLASLPKTYGEARELGATAPPPAKKDADKPGAQPALIDLDATDEAALGSMPLHYAVEPRSEGFGSAEAVEIFKKYDTALVMADTGGRYPQFDEVTASLVYVRLHGSPRMYYSKYSDEALQEWADKALAWKHDGLQTYFYFDNTAGGWAPYNAQTLEQMCEVG